VFFDPNITNILRSMFPWAGPFFIALSELGSEMFYIVIILIAYWTYEKREAILAACVLLASVTLNYWLKLFIANERPPQSYWYPGYEAANYSTPSGHAQNSTVFFGWASLRARRTWLTVLSIVLIVLIGISRIYLGVHYLGDVLIGWAVGLALLFVIHLLERPLRERFENLPAETPFVLLFLFGVIATLVSTLFPAPPSDNYGALGGLTMGIALAVPLEKRLVGFETVAPQSQRWRLVLRVVIGLLLVLGMMVGLSGVLPSSDLALRTLRYAAVVFAGVFVWPLIFKRLRL